MSWTDLGPHFSKLDMNGFIRKPFLEHLHMKHEYPVISCKTVCALLMLLSVHEVVHMKLWSWWLMLFVLFMFLHQSTIWKQLNSGVTPHKNEQLLPFLQSHHLDLCWLTRPGQSSPPSQRVLLFAGWIFIQHSERSVLRVRVLQVRRYWWYGSASSAALHELRNYDIWYTVYTAWPASNV